jgi:type IV pilus assembly protein PilB
MIQFDDDKEETKLKEVQKREEEDLVRILAEAKYDMPSVDLATIVVDNEALRMIPEAKARELLVAPFKLLGKNLSVAVISPENPALGELREEIGKKGFDVTFYMASHASLEKVWSRYKELSFASSSKAGGIDISGETIAEIAEKIKTVKDVKRTVDESVAENKTHKISHILEIILAGGISVDASDIHIEPEENEVKVRFRLDGVLIEIMSFDFPTYKLLNSRIKLLSGLKLTTSASAQDGRFSIFIKQDEISMRTSMLPGAYGESIVMRILNPKSIQVKLEDLGIPKKLFSIIESQIKKPNGLILITGPTGSGKTTTLYAFLKRIYSSELKIITIEDPIEYHLAGITQTQVEDAKHYTFLEGLRSALRQDPDVIMVGEIRDDETAKIAVESALTGHLVFSTLHTNNAPGVIPRLIDLSVNPKTLTSALSLSMAQRLVRKLCENCKKQRPTTEFEEKTIRNILNTAVAEGKDLSEYNVTPDQAFVLYDAVGCDMCNGTGFKGRQGIYEAILTDEAIEKIIPENPSEREIKKVSSHQGILDMKEDGVIKVIHGITSLAEVKSVVDLDVD